MHLNRRTWLRWALAQSLAGASLASWARTAERVTFESNPFRLGVASGDPTSRSVVLWTRLMPVNPLRNPWEDRNVHVEWQLAPDPSFTAGVQRGETWAPPELAHSVHAEIEGLQPNQVYWYRFVSGAYTSPVGRTRTLPAPDDASPALTLAVASCQRYHAGPFVAYDMMAADDPDLVVFLGDYIYEMGAREQEVRGTWAWPANTLADYRGLYELARSDPSLQRMHAACPWLVTWDDHEVINDYAGGEVRIKGDTGRLAKRMAIGYRAWYEHMPVSLRALTGGIAGLMDNAHELRLYGAYRWGRLANLSLLDTRQYRSPQSTCGVAGLFQPSGCTDWQDAGRSMLGEAQARWLGEQFRTHGEGRPDAALWHAICQPSVFSRFPIPVLGGSLNRDAWDGYPVARHHLLGQLAEARTRNPVFFSGDVHQNWVAHVHRNPDDPASPVLAPEFCVTSVTTPSFGSFTAEEMKALAPHAVYADRHRRGYGLAHFTPQSLKVTIRHVDVLTGAGGTGATFEVRAGDPRIRPMG